MMSNDDNTFAFGVSCCQNRFRQTDLLAHVGDVLSLFWPSAPIEVDVSLSLIIGMSRFAHKVIDPQYTIYTIHTQYTYTLTILYTQYTYILILHTHIHIYIHIANGIICMYKHNHTWTVHGPIAIGIYLMIV